MQTNPMPPYLQMEAAINEARVLLRILGERFQQELEQEGQAGGSEAAGLQTLRWGVVERLDAAYAAWHAEQIQLQEEAGMIVDPHPPLRAPRKRR